MTTPSGKLIGPKQRKVALLGSRSVGASSPPRARAHLGRNPNLERDELTLVAPRPPPTPRRQVVAHGAVCRPALCRQLLPDHREHVHQAGQVQGPGLPARHRRHGRSGASRPSPTRSPSRGAPRARADPRPQQDEFSILSSRHAVGLHGWILVYSVSSRSSFEMCSIIREKILNYTGRDSVPMVLVGNKSDLAVQRCVPLSLSLVLLVPRARRA